MYPLFSDPLSCRPQIATCVSEVRVDHITYVLLYIAVCLWWKTFALLQFDQLLQDFSLKHFRTLINIIL